MIFISGTVFSSFAVCHGWRFANSYSFSSRSFCEKCHVTLKNIHLIPILGFLIQGGRCFFCHSKISAVSFAIEFLGGCYFLCLFVLTADTANFIFISLLSLWSLILALQDFYSLTVSNFLLWFGGSLFLLEPSSEFRNFWGDLNLIFFFIITLSIFTYFNFLGLGDVIYLGFLFLILGFYTTLYIIMIGSSCAVIYQLVTNRRKIAFIPFLSFGLFLLLLWQKTFTC
ncbi:prepilin peptidase [Liquorilactobacillus uvarum]|uniref:prepilin peptidase n=1 Tax=Liquorilactobacillus uvarum TaxID=303240 RepID=UPI00138F5A28|nr:prepilin peptidase [Liquorilactobacillus uvarum]